MRSIDADALKAEYGMKDDCKDCEKELHGKVKSCEYDRVYTKMDFCGWIDSMPTIEPERKTGKWIHDGFDHPHGVDWIHCSVCGRREPNVPAAKTSYCPTCGAKMEEGEQDG